MNKIQHTDLGMSAYIEWATLDVILQRWVNDTFGNIDRKIPIHVYAARDEMGFNIELADMAATDITAWNEIFSTYDREKDWDSVEEFRTGTTAAVLPGDMSRRILCDAVVKHTCIGFTPKAIIANEYGIVFYELAPKGFSMYFSAEDEV